MNTLTDNALMMAVKNGKTDNLGLLYERHKKWVFHFFLQMNGHRDVSEDMVQNVFMRILKYRHTFTEESKFVTWMFQIARNVSNDYFRKNSKTKNSLDVAHVAYKLSENNTGEVAIEKEENIALLHKALQKLSVEKREIIVLSKLKELKYKEVGAIIGCTEDTARMKAHRALKELKTVYFTIQN